MALDVKKGSFAKSTGGAPASQAVTGIGFQPKALILWATNQTTEVIAFGIRFGIGFSDGTRYRAVAAASADNSDFTSCDHRQATKALTLLDFTQTTVAECDVTSFDSDGFTLNWTTNNASAYIIHYLAIGGADLTNVRADNFSLATSTGNQAITGAGFQPDFVMFLSARDSGAIPNTAVHTYLSLGLAKSSSERAALAFASQDNAGTSETNRYQRTTLCLATLADSGTVDSEADFVSMDSDGFTINNSDAPTLAHKVMYLALKGGSYKVGAETQKTSTGTKATTGAGFQPTGLFLASFNDVAQTTPQPHHRFSVGAASAAGVEGASWIGDTDAAATSSTNMSTLTTKVIHLINADDPASPSAEADLSSLDSDGFTLDWTTADATAREFVYLAIGSTGGGGTPVSQTATLRLEALAGVPRVASSPYEALATPVATRLAPVEALRGATRTSLLPWEAAGVPLVSSAIAKQAEYAPAVSLLAEHAPVIALSASYEPTLQLEGQL